MPAGLSIVQKREISMTARKAYGMWDGREAFEAVNSEVSKSACFEAWRHVEQGKASGGIQSLCEMTQDHYADVYAYFLDLAGDHEGAQRVRARAATNGSRIALHKVREELRKRGLSDDYAATICRSKFKCGLHEASEGQLWKIMYDVRKRPIRTPVAQLENEDPF